jgi:hypothetical protein
MIIAKAAAAHSRSRETRRKQHAEGFEEVLVSIEQVTHR